MVDCISESNRMDGIPPHVPVDYLNSLDQVVVEDHDLPSPGPSSDAGSSPGNSSSVQEETGAESTGESSPVVEVSPVVLPQGDEATAQPSDVSHSGGPEGSDDSHAGDPNEPHDGFRGVITPEYYSRVPGKKDIAHTKGGETPISISKDLANAMTKAGGTNATGGTQAGSGGSTPGLQPAPVKSTVGHATPAPSIPPAPVKTTVGHGTPAPSIHPAPVKTTVGHGTPAPIIHPAPAQPAGVHPSGSAGHPA